jgi:hypothetical protein
MTSTGAPGADELLAAVFSDDPAPDVYAAVVVSHSGDECMGASWLLSRLYDRASVFRLTSRTAQEAEAAEAITLTGLPRERCHDLGLRPGTLATDLQTLTWLVAAAVQGLAPRLLITHAGDGSNLDHDAVAFAVRMTSLLLPRFGGAAPVLLEFPCQHDGQEPVDHEAFAAETQNAVRVEFGPESRRLKARILQTCLGPLATVSPCTLDAEIYRPLRAGKTPDSADNLDRRYLDASWCSVKEFRTNALAVIQEFARDGLIAGPAV